MPFLADIFPVDKALLHTALKVDVQRIHIAEEAVCRHESGARALARVSRFCRGFGLFLLFLLLLVFWTLLPGL